VHHTHHRRFAWKLPEEGWPFCPEIYRTFGDQDAADDSLALWELTQGLATPNLAARGEYLFNHINLPQVILPSSFARVQRDFFSRRGAHPAHWMGHVRFCRYRFPATDLNFKATWFGIQ
jgi:hypothetical protein